MYKMVGIIKTFLFSSSTLLLAIFVKKINFVKNLVSVELPNKSVEGGILKQNK